MLRKPRSINSREALEACKNQTSELQTADRVTKLEPWNYVEIMPILAVEFASVPVAMKNLAQICKTDASE